MMSEATSSAEVRKIQTISIRMRKRDIKFQDILIQAMNELRSAGFPVFKPT